MVRQTFLDQNSCRSENESAKRRDKKKIFIPTIPFSSARFRANAFSGENGRFSHIEAVPLNLLPLSPISAESNGEVINIKTWLMENRWPLTWARRSCVAFLRCKNWFTESRASADVVFHLFYPSLPQPFLSFALRASINTHYLWRFWTVVMCRPYRGETTCDLPIDHLYFDIKLNRANCFHRESV